MDFSLNRFNNHHPQPRAAAVVDLMMMESSPSSPSPPLRPISSSSVFELEEATTAAVVGSRVEDSDNDHGIRIGIGSNCCSTDHAEKEHMFDKVVTPSDVGKLNRLVIPKQHAERFFPLNSSTNEKGLLLNFEDRNGKSWRFRYSYWNSSQSYVMTKGWSRFVKEKRLDAGDIVSFERGVGELARDRLFIDWRRRPEHPPSLRHNLMQLPPHAHGQFSCRPSIVPAAAWSSLMWRPTGPYPPVPRDHMHLSPLNNNSTIDWSNSYGRSGGYSYGYGSVVKPESAESAVYYLRSGMEDGRGGGVSPQLVEGQEIGMLRQRQIPTSDDGGGGGGGDGAVIYESMPMVVQGNLRTPKRSRLRLFGVNMECPISSAASSDECDLFLSSSNHTTTAISSSTTQFPPPSPPSPHG